MRTPAPGSPPSYPSPRSKQFHPAPDPRAPRSGLLGHLRAAWPALPALRAATALLLCALRRSGARLRPHLLPPLPPRGVPRFLLQGPSALPLLLRPSHECPGGPSRGSRPARCPPAPVGAHRALRNPRTPRLRSQASLTPAPHLRPGDPAFLRSSNSIDRRTPAARRSRQLRSPCGRRPSHQSTVVRHTDWSTHATLVETGTQETPAHDFTELSQEVSASFTGSRWRPVP
jgi:hypothetical protein